MKLRQILNGRSGLTRRIGLSLMAVAMAAALMPGSAAGGPGEAGRIKTETVYAVLENGGGYSGATVVNCFNQSGEIVDYGQYIDVKNLMGPESPVIDGDTITWPVSATEGNKSFYYQGETKKSLPFGISIGYLLNGEIVGPEDIAGKSGELKIEFRITNETGLGEIDEMTKREIFVPFAVQVSLALDNEKYTVLGIPGNASSVLAGSSYTLSYASFPLPEDEFSFTVFGRDIELEPINIVVIPKAPPGLDSFGDFIDVDGMEEGADEMIDGTGEMQQGVDDLLGALQTMRDAAEEMESAMGDIDDGADELAGGADEIYANAKVLKSSAVDYYEGMSEFAAAFAEFDAGMGLLETNIADMTVSLAGLAAGTASVDAGVAGISAGLDGVSTSNAQLKALADVLDDTYPISDLTNGLQAQQGAIDTLLGNSAALNAVSTSVNNGMQEFYTGFSTDFSGSVSQLRASSATLYAACLELLSGAYEIKGGCAGLAAALKDLSSGAGGLASGTEEIKGQLPDLISGIDEMIDGVHELSGGLATLSDDGLKELKDDINGLEGYLDKLAGKADEYGSFMDERNAAISTVQFVLKTEGISAKED